MRRRAASADAYVRTRRTRTRDRSVDDERARDAYDDDLEYEFRDERPLRGVKVTSPAVFKPSSMDIHHWLSSTKAWTSVSHPAANEEQKASIIRFNLSIQTQENLSNMNRDDPLFWNSVTKIEKTLLSLFDKPNKRENACEKLHDCFMINRKIHAYHENFVKHCASAAKNPDDPEQVALFFRHLNNEALPGGLKVHLQPLREKPGCTLMDLVKLSDSLLTASYGVDYASSDTQKTVDLADQSGGYRQSSKDKAAKAKAAKARGQPPAQPNATEQKLDDPCTRCGNLYHSAKVCNAGWMYNRKGDAAAKLPIETSAYAKAGKEGWTGTKYP